MRTRGLTLVELLVALALAAAVTAAVLRVTVASGRQQQALLQGGALQAELRRGLGAAQQAVGEG
ncbi:prepilin-type N-terminal cleavage/methylation domain-containing protein, partial [Calidithermus roseus]|uniref:prepilin-type N-terminal cleavage/methylation domain-containing protein n=1 Tax=Calidithermus roseus TaxID=1644118 RepID=UPI000E64D2A1